MFSFQHIVAYKTLGITLPPNEASRELLNDDRAGIRMVATRDPDSYCMHADKGLAAAHLLLTGGFGSMPGFDERLDQHVADIRQARRAKATSGLFLVLVRSGTIDEFSPDAQREVDQFIITLDGFDSEVIREESRSRFARAILALTMATGKPVGTEKVSDSVTLFRSDGKPIYPRAFTMGTLTVWVSASPESLNSTDEWFNAVETHPELNRVYQLFVSSIEFQDRLRSFLSIWTALEIFLNKAFGSYEQLLFQRLGDGQHPEVWNRYLDRIREVMKDKYRLADKFFVISTSLDPASADADYQEFRLAKDLRDRLAHGQDVDEGSLPASSIRNLLRKYLQLHVRRLPAV